MRRAPAVLPATRTTLPPPTPRRRPTIDAAATFGAAVGAGEDPETAAEALWQAVRGEGLSARSQRLMVALCFASAGAAALAAIGAAGDRAAAALEVDA